MILSCDPPRHALLIHFGSRRQTDIIQEVDAKYHGAITQVALALSPRSALPALVAVHFVRHQFRLPFVRTSEPYSSTNGFHLQFGFRQDRYFFHFVYAPRDFEEWQAVPGLTVLVSPPRTPGEGLRRLEERPALQGLRVDPAVLRLEVDSSEFVYAFGPDNLKDVEATLFITRTRA